MRCWKPICRWNDDVKMYYRSVGSENMDQFEVTHDRVQHGCLW